MEKAKDWTKKGDGWHDKGEYQKAIECYDKAIEAIEAIEANPTYVAAYCNKGNTLEKLGRYRDAIEYYDKVLEFAPQDSSAYYNKGLAVHKLGEYQEAIALYDKAITLNPNRADVYNNKGNALDALGEYQEAIICYDRAIELEPNNIIAFYNKGNELLKLRQYRDAILFYDKAIKLRPDYPNVYHNKADALSSLGEFQRAIECYDKTIELRPDDARAYNRKGDLLLQLGEYQRAIECYDKVIELKPGDVHAHSYKGHALLKLGEYQRAIECYDKAIELAPNVLNIYNKKTALQRIAEKEKTGAPSEDIETYMKLYNAGFFEETIEGSQEEEREDYDNIYTQSLKILAHLQIKGDDREKYVAHYTTAKTANILFFDARKDENKIFPKLRLFSVTNSNDQQEGKTLFHYLFDGLKISPQAEKYVAFAACFMFNHDNLNQFRLYGKKDDTEEGTGVSIVMNTNFFCQDDRLPLPMFEKENGKRSIYIDPDTNQISFPMSEKENEKSPLYRCIYIDPDTNQIVSIGHRDDHTFYKTKEIIFNYPERDECIAAISDEITDYKKVINEKRNTVISLMKELKKMIYAKSHLDRRIVCDLLLNLRYLVKHVAFKEEQECRIIEIRSSSSDNENKPECEDNKRFFVNYRPLTNSVHKVYFGPRAEGMELFQNRLAFESGFENVVCTRSTAPLA